MSQTIKVYPIRNKWHNVTKLTRKNDRNNQIPRNVSKIRLLTKGVCYEATLKYGKYFLFTDIDTYQPFDTKLFLTVSKSRNNKLEELGI